MKKIFLTTIAGLLIAINAFAYSGGNGSEDSPWLISLSADLQELATAVNAGTNYAGKYFRLTRDLTGFAGGIGYVNATTTRPFSGTFDGDGYGIALTTRGLFCRLLNATVKNLTVSGTITTISYSSSSSSGTNFYIYDYTGGICGSAESSAIINCINKASITVSASYSHSAPTLTTDPNRSYRSYFRVGGICGDAIGNTVIQTSYNAGNVSASITGRSNSIGPVLAGGPYAISYAYPYSYVGGICGFFNDISTAAVSNCYNTGTLSSSASRGGSYGTPYSYVGGVGGYAGSTNAKMENCYSTGNITALVSTGANAYSGFVCGYGGSVKNCFAANGNNTNTAGATNNVGRIGGSNGAYTNNHAEGLSAKLNNNALSSTNANSKDGRDCTTANLQSQSWLETTLLWDFENAWFMPNGQFPILKMQKEAVQTTTISFTMEAVEYGDQADLNATSNNPAAITYTSSNNTIAEISGNTLTAKKAGNVTITALQLAGNGFSAGSQPFNLTISKAPLTITANNASRKQGEANPTFTLSYSGFKFTDDEEALDLLPTISCTATESSPVGFYGIVLTDGSDSNYEYQLNDGELEVTALTNTVIAFTIGAVTYGDQINLNDYATSNNPAAITYDSSDDTVAEISGNTLITKKAGNVTITASQSTGNGFLAGSQPFDLTISKAPLTITARSVSSVYGNNLPAFTPQYSGFVNGETEGVLTGLPNLISTATAQSNAGEYFIIPSGTTAQNYTISHQPGTLTIQKRSVEATPVNASRAYGDANPAFTFSYSDLVNGDTAADIEVAPAAATDAVATSPAGNYLVTCSGGSATNYEFSGYGMGILTITKAPLSITANDAVRNQGEANPIFTLSYSGFKNGEDESILSQLPTISCSATEASPAGFYDIVLSGGLNGNYEYQLTNGQLEVVAPNNVEQVSASGIALYPNPAKQNLYIKSHVPVEKVEAYNALGACVLIKNNVTGALDVSALPAGIYLFRIYAEGTSAVWKIVIED